MPPLRRDLGQRTEHERTPMHPQVRNGQIASVQDTVIVGEDVDGQSSRCVSHTTYPSELRLQRAHRLQQLIWGETRPQANHCVPVLRLRRPTLRLRAVERRYRLHL